MSDDATWAAFFELHAGLPRQGPGSDAATRRAYGLLDGLPPRPRVLDLGCGPGMQTLELARLSAGRVVAIDNHPPFLDELKRHAEAAGLSDRIDARPGDIRALELEPAGFDVVWSEGAIYLVGFERGLTAWRPLLREGGWMAVTEATWLRADAPAECRAVWDEGYPAMTDVEGNLETIRGCGYRSLGHFALPESTWWDPYYEPLEERLESVERDRGDDPSMRAVIAETRAEIDLFRRFSEYYGYVFYVMRAQDG
jgi:SAM-dependent methyltransferase